MIIAYILKDCYYSNCADDLLKKQKIKFKKIEVPQDESIKNKLKKLNKMSTFPQIMYKKNETSKIEKIGGYDDLLEYMEIRNTIKQKKLNKCFLEEIL
jgi:glutaredoxin